MERLRDIAILEISRAKLRWSTLVVGGRIMIVNLGEVQVNLASHAVKG